MSSRIEADSESFATAGQGLKEVAKEVVTDKVDAEEAPPKSWLEWTTQLLKKTAAFLILFVVCSALLCAALCVMKSAFDEQVPLKEILLTLASLLIGSVYCCFAMFLVETMFEIKTLIFHRTPSKLSLD